MASSIRVRANATGEITEVQALIQHPMDTGLVKDSKGELIPAHFIQELKFECNGKDVFVANWGTAVSKDPYVKFSFKGAKKGDELKISWTDNKGASDTTTAKIAIKSAILRNVSVLFIVLETPKSENVDKFSPTGLAKDTGYPCNTERALIERRGKCTLRQNQPERTPYRDEG